jgi:hypothetical protein
LPEHDLVINSIGNPEVSAHALECAGRILTQSRAPLINHPDAVMKTGREDNAVRLGRIEGVAAPLTRTIERAVLAAADAPRVLDGLGFRFPLLLRSPGYHTGRHFLKVDDADGFNAAQAVLPGSALTVIQYMDARGPDGSSRKYRVMMIDGRLYPLHLAISENWMVHYFTADMGLSEEHRAEEARFLDDMPGVVGPTGMAALERIRDALGLDYAGVDFALDAEGRLVLFEANATMVILPVAPGERWDYRRPAIGRAMAAVHALIRDRAGRPARV